MILRKRLNEHCDSSRPKELFLPDETIVSYDLTTTYFEGKKTGSIKAQVGKSKETRNDRKLI